MTWRSRKSSSCSRPTGMTLVETVAALALLAALLTGILSAKRAFVRQWSKASQRAAAVAAADELLANWWLEPSRLPRWAEGEISGATPLLWRTRPIPNTSVEQLGGQVVRLEIFDSPTGNGDSGTRSRDGEPLVAACTVDVVLPAGAR